MIFSFIVVVCYILNTTRPLIITNNNITKTKINPTVKFTFDTKINGALMFKAIRCSNETYV